MGKRSHLNNTSMYTCDWTGLPVNPEKRYARPVFSEGKKGQRMSRQGCYLSPECVVAHLQWMKDKGEITDKTLDKSKLEINKVACRVVPEAPLFNRLEHFGGDWSIEEYKHHLNRRELPVMVVSITASGEIFSSVCLPTDGSFKQTVRQWPHTVQPIKKIRLTKGHKVVLHCNLDSNGNELNTVASNLCKVNVYGDAALTLHDEFDELLDYHLDQYKAHWTCTQRKRPVSAQSNTTAATPGAKATAAKTPEEYQAEYNKLEESLKAIEKKETSKLSCASASVKSKKQRVKAAPQAVAA